MPSTGHKCQTSGIYGNDCHAKQIALSVGETFPPCSNCRGPPTGGSSARRVSSCLSGARVGRAPGEWRDHDERNR